MDEVITWAWVLDSISRGKESEHEHHLYVLTVDTAQPATFPSCCHTFLTMMDNTLKLPVGRSSFFPKLLMPGILDHQPEK